MNRRRFLGLAAAFAAAPIAPTIAAVKPALTLGDILTPEIFAPYAPAIESGSSDYIAKYWARRLATAYHSALSEVLP